MMSLVCNVVGAAPVGGVIVGASPALPVTAGNPAADSDTVSFPPKDVIVANAIAATAKTRVVEESPCFQRSVAQSEQQNPSVPHTLRSSNYQPMF